MLNTAVLSAYFLKPTIPTISCGVQASNGYIMQKRVGGIRRANEKTLKKTGFFSMSPKPVFII
jgi:hypothetical protein